MNRRFKIYQNELVKESAFKGFPKRRLLTLRDKAFNFVKNKKNDGYQRGLALMIYKFFDNKYSCSEPLTFKSGSCRVRFS